MYQYPQYPWTQQQVQTSETTALPYQIPPQQQFFPGSPMQPMPPGFTQQFPTSPPGMLPLEQSYIENILRLNRGRVGTFYLTYENNVEWNAKIFRGVVEEAGRDHIIISDPQAGKYYLLLMINLDYVVFDEPIAYDVGFGVVPGTATAPTTTPAQPTSVPSTLATYSPR